MIPPVNIQARIVKAVRSGLKEKARGRQRLLANSLAAKLTAINQAGYIQSWKTNSGY